MYIETATSCLILPTMDPYEGAFREMPILIWWSRSAAPQAPCLTKSIYYVLHCECSFSQVTSVYLDSEVPLTGVHH